MAKAFYITYKRECILLCILLCSLSIFRLDNVGFVSHMPLPNKLLCTNLIIIMFSFMVTLQLCSFCLLLVFGDEQKLRTTEKKRYCLYTKFVICDLLCSSVIFFIILKENGKTESIANKNVLQFHSFFFLPFLFWQNNMDIYRIHPFLFR